MPIAVEFANGQQSQTILSILIEAAQWLVSIGRPMWRIDGFDLRQIQLEVEAGRFLLASVDGDPAGVVEFQLTDQEFWPDVPDGESVFLHRLAIRRRYARQGVPDALIAYAAEESARLGRRFLRLDCVVDRMPLRTFYERLGFRHHSDFVAGEWHVARYEMMVASDADHLTRRS